MELLIASLYTESQQASINNVKTPLKPLLNQKE